MWKSIDENLGKHTPIYLPKENMWQDLLILGIGWVGRNETFIWLASSFVIVLPILSWIFPMHSWSSWYKGHHRTLSFCIVTKITSNNMWMVKRYCFTFSKIWHWMIGKDAYCGISQGWNRNCGSTLDWFFRVLNFHHQSIHLTLWETEITWNV